MAEGDAADTVAYAAPAQTCPEENARLHPGDGFAKRTTTGVRTRTDRTNDGTQ